MITVHFHELPEESELMGNRLEAGVGESNSICLHGEDRRTCQRRRALVA
jgi:hypothetical protein